MIKYLVAVGLAAILCQIWSSISWMALPWHQSTTKTVADSEAILSAFAQQAEETGVYIIPGMENPEAAMNGSQLLAAYRATPSKSMGALSGQYFLINIIACAVLGFIVYCTRTPTFKGRLLLSLLIGLFAAIVSHLPNWNWWSVPTGRTMVLFVDSMIYSLLAGLAFALLLNPKEDA